MPDINGFYTPSEWGSDRPSRYTAMHGEDVGPMELWVAHWPGTSQQFSGGIQESYDALRSYERYHVHTKGWRGIAYDYAADLAGRRFLLRGTGQSGATSGDYDEDGIPNNRETDAVLFLIGPGQQPSAQMVAAAHWLTSWSRRPWRGHRQVSTPRDCPGDLVMRDIVRPLETVKETWMPSKLIYARHRSPEAGSAVAALNAATGSQSRGYAVTTDPDEAREAHAAGVDVIEVGGTDDVPGARKVIGTDGLDTLAKLARTI